MGLTHFHSPSEHTVDGQHYDLELHFVMMNGECPFGAGCFFGNLGVFFDV